MELQLVSKEVAILAKELGFDWGTNNIIDENDCLSSHVKIHRRRFKNSKEDVYNLALPEQELLAKWLRKKFKYNINTYTFSDGGKWSSCIYKEGIKTIIGFVKVEETYEDSLEKGLMFVLNQIKELKLHVI